MQSNPSRNTAGAVEKYTVTYTFNGHLRQKADMAISLIRQTVMGMQAEGIDIDFLGAIGEINTSGQVIELTARYTAPSEGTVGRLNWRAGLPASGSPQRTDTADDTADQTVIAAT